MHDWMEEMLAGQRVLDLGAGAGSLTMFSYPCTIIALDSDKDAYSASFDSTPSTRVVGTGEQLPFAPKTFDLVLCQHVLEHVTNVEETLSEMSRVLNSTGRIYLAVPNGYGLCDGIYRYVFQGGGHVNRFDRKRIIDLVEARVRVRLTGWQKLYSSFAYLARIKGLNKAILPNMPRPVQLLFVLPEGLLLILQGALYWGTRIVDTLLGSDWALYGWAFYFESIDSGAAAEASEKPSYINVCLHCGAGHAAIDLRRRYRLFFRCPNCDRVGLYFPPLGNTL